MRECWDTDASLMGSPLAAETCCHGLSLHSLNFAPHQKSCLGQNALKVLRTNCFRLASRQSLASGNMPMHSGCLGSADGQSGSSPPSQMSISRPRELPWRNGSAVRNRKADPCGTSSTSRDVAHDSLTDGSASRASICLHSGDPGDTSCEFAKIREKIRHITT